MSGNILSDIAAAIRRRPEGHPIRFGFNESKAVEVVVLVAQCWSGITPSA
jgi:hypothetical protein